MTSPLEVRSALKHVRSLLERVRAAEAALDYLTIVWHCRAALDELNAIAPGSERDAMQDAVFGALIRALDRLGQYADAQEAVAQWQSCTHDPQALVEAQIAQARLLMRQGSFDNALLVLDEAMSHSQADGFLCSLGQASRIRADILWTLGQTEQALLLAQQALTIFEQVGDLHLQAQAHLTLGLIQYFMGRYYLSIQHNKRAVSFFEVVGDQYGVGLAYNNMGESYQQLYDMETALQCHQKALSIFGQESSSIDLIRNLGVDLVGVGYAEEGMGHLNRALQQARVRGDRDIFFQALHSLAEAHLRLGNVEAAQAAAGELLAEAHMVGSVRHITRAMLILGHCAQLCGDAESALEYFHEGFLAGQRAADKYTIWQTHAALAELTAKDQPAMAEVHRMIAAEMLRAIVSTIEDERLRKTFRQAAPVRALLDEVDSAAD